jgi:hypothetical protein
MIFSFDVYAIKVSIALRYHTVLAWLRASISRSKPGEDLTPESKVKWSIRPSSMHITAFAVQLSEQTHEFRDHKRGNKERIE